VVDGLTKRWSGHDLSLVPATNEMAARADLVVLATPVEGAVNTVRTLVDELSGKILVSMVNAMVKWGDRFVPLMPYTGSVALALSRVVPPRTWRAPSTTCPPDSWGTRTTSSTPT